jgi:hypothetical protein
VLQPVHYECVSAAYVAQFGPLVVAEEDGVHQAARTGDNRSPATRATHDRDSKLVAAGHINFCRHARRPAGNDHRSRRLPQSENFSIVAVRFGPIQQCFIERDIFGGRRQCQIQALHARVFP